MKSEIRKSPIATPRQVLALGLIASAITLAVIGCSTTSAAKKGSPAVYKVVFENEKVRVIEYHTGSEKGICGFGMHTHPAHLYIMKTDAKQRIVTPDGKESFENAKAGEVGWEPAEQHIAENMDGKDAACYVIEIKDKDWKPSTGLTR
jgi:hypothetical protein